MRYDLDRGDLNLAFHQVTFTPNDRWSWGSATGILRNGFVSTEENNFIWPAPCYFRVNDNWGLRAAHTFNAHRRPFAGADPTRIMRDLRSWTGALTFRVQNNAGSSADFTVAFAFSLKAIPIHAVGRRRPAVNYHSGGRIIPKAEGVK